jgi:hypothetical protein
MGNQFEPENPLCRNPAPWGQLIQRYFATVPPAVLTGSVPTQDGSFQFFYVPLAYILHLLESFRFLNVSVFPGNFEFSGIVCN